MSPNGIPTGVLQLGDNGSDYMVLNDRPSDLPGPNRPEWSSLTATYVGMAYGTPDIQHLTLRNGYLYWADSLKLFPYRKDLFFTADGDAVEFFPGGKLRFANKEFEKEP